MSPCAADDICSARYGGQHQGRTGSRCSTRSGSNDSTGDENLLEVRYVVMSNSRRDFHKSEAQNIASGKERQVAAEAQKRGARSAYCGLILDCVGAGDLIQAEKWIHRLKNEGLVIPKGFCRHIIRRMMHTDGDGKVKQLSTAAAINASTWLKGLATVDVVVDRATINLLMALFARRGLWMEATQWAQYMQQHDIRPNESTFRALVTASLNANQQSSAESWLQAMIREGLQPGGLDASEEAESGAAWDLPMKAGPMQLGGAASQPPSRTIDGLCTRATTTTPASYNGALTQSCPRWGGEPWKVAPLFRRGEEDLEEIAVMRLGDVEVAPGSVARVVQRLSL